MTRIGSSAIKHWFQDFPREPKDIDYAIQFKIKSPEKGIEYIYNPIIPKYNIRNDMYCSPDHLYTLKLSHLFWDINWDKHMFDLQFLKNKGCKLVPNLFNELYEFWNQYHGERKTSDLTMSPDQFFNNAINYNLDHDKIHEIINPNPLYKKILVGDGTVNTSEDKWNLLTNEEKQDLIREETMVMSYERLAGRDYRTAYKWQMKQLILKHLPIWQAIFAIENYPVIYLPKFNYKEKIEKQLNYESI